MNVGFIINSIITAFVYSVDENLLVEILRSLLLNVPKSALLFLPWNKKTQYIV